MEVENTIADEFTRISVLKSRNKIKSIDLYTETLTKSKVRESNSLKNEEEIFFECKISCLLQNNQIEMYLLKLNKKMNPVEPISLYLKLDAAAHRSDVRTICFSSDSSAFVSASGESMKIWNRMSLSPIRTFNCDYALSSLFLADDNHVLIGTNVN